MKYIFDKFKKIIICTTSKIETIANTATALTFIIGLCQFLEYKDDLKKQKTYSQITKLFDSPLYESRKKLMLTESELITLKKLHNSSKDFNSVFLYYTQKKVDTNYYEFATVFDYFITFYECLQSDICSSSDISTSFKSSGENFFRTYYGYICHEYLHKSLGHIDMKLEAITFYTDIKEPCLKK